MLGDTVYRWLSAVCGEQIPFYGGTINLMSSPPADMPSQDKVSLEEFSMSEVSEHCRPDSCWLVIWDMVFDVTHFLKDHPGSEELILEHAGQDATTVFSEVGHSHDAKRWLAKYNIGILRKSDRLHIMSG